METHRRTILKTISWRFIAMVVTALIGWAFTKDPRYGLAIGVTDTIIKFFVYYFHERAWTRVSMGYVAPTGSSDG